MLWWVHIAGGAALCLAAWLVPRRIAQARLGRFAALLVDAAPFGIGALLLALGSARPLFAGLVVFALGVGFALADYTMRDTLHEPIVFSEMSEVPHIFTHPHLYLPFAGPGLVIGGTALAIGVGLGLLVFEPETWTARPLSAAGAIVVIVGFGRLASREPLLGRLAALLRRLRPSGEPFADATALGPFAMLLTHCVIARAERPARRARVPVPNPQRTTEGSGNPLVMVQCESFFDARRLTTLVSDELLDGFAACCRTGLQWGRLDVPGWGANTMRAEFAALTGIPEASLGYDRFNPYHAFARVPVASQVWRLREAGYRTICLHPFDRGFFRRDLAMPSLGFDSFLARETLGGSSKPPYCGDPDLAGHILRVLDETGPRTFIFAITMGNHGPWMATGHQVPDDLAALFEEGVPQRDELLRYLDGIRRSDEMLRLLMNGLERYRGAVLGFYGDHVPSLPRAFDHFGFHETTSDYVVWPRGAEASVRRDLPAHQLGRLLVDRLLGVGRDDVYTAPIGKFFSSA